MKFNSTFKAACLLVALIFVFGVARGRAYFIDYDTSVNAFAVGNVSVGLSESVDSQFDFVPGVTHCKDPVVTVCGGSVACWLFIKCEAENNALDGVDGSLVSWSVRTGEDDWIPVPGCDGFWYREVEATEEDISFYILEGCEAYPNGCVTINEDVSTGMIDDINAAKPVLKFTAAAVQRETVADVSAAWGSLPKEFTNGG